MGHIVLLGDSVFDNASYVPGEMSVIEQLREELPGWQASLRAVDGHVTTDILGQLRNLPDNVSHLVLSCGGNDALNQISHMTAPTNSIEVALNRLADIREAFEKDYRLMLEGVLKLGHPTAVCTIYEHVPGLNRALHVGLCLFNDVILREAARFRVPVIDLRLICVEPQDYSAISPIEPSSLGGRKIVRAIASLMQFHDFSTKHWLLSTKV
jgi:hypothetical protein